MCDHERRLAKVLCGAVLHRHEDGRQSGRARRPDHNRSQPDHNQGSVHATTIGALADALTLRYSSLKHGFPGDVCRFGGK